jgi:hypothetical protein
MPGTIPSLPLSTQFDKDTGLPLRGGKLSFIQAGTVSTPQNAFQDTGLSIALPNPVTLDGAGRIPNFYLADGSIHIRLVNSRGVVQLDVDNLLVVGPSSGGGGGSTVDPTSLFQTGDVTWLDQSGPRSGWVRDNANTIGSSTSGASERANPDCQSLFEFLWNTYSDTLCPVVGGRGANAAADWAANKQITLPDKRGYSPKGDTAMGSTDSARLAGVPFSTGNSSAVGSLGGEAMHTLTVAESPHGLWTYAFHDPGHPHGIDTNSGPGGGAQNVVANSNGSTFGTTNTNTASTGITSTMTDNSGGGAHPNEGLIVIGTFYRKL